MPLQRSDGTRRLRLAPVGPAMGPPRYKLAIASWLSVYPAITLLLWGLGPFVSGWPIPAVTLLLSAILVIVQTFAGMPLMTRLLRPWLTRPSRGFAAGRASGQARSALDGDGSRVAR